MELWKFKGLLQGTHFFKFSIGDDKVNKITGEGFGAYFRKENDFAGSFGVEPNKDFYFRYVHNCDSKVPAFFSLGIGDWGKADGYFELKKFELFKEKSRNFLQKLYFRICISV